MAEAEQNPENQASAEGRDPGAAQDGPQAGPSGPSAEAAGAPGAKDEKVQASKGPQEDKGERKTAKDAEATPDDPQRKTAFEVYGKALENVDWTYKNQQGVGREIAHKSVVNVERAYVIAALHDKDQADKLYEEAAGRPPKAELQKRVEEARRLDPTQGIKDLSGDIASLSERQKMWGLTLNKTQLEKQMSDWEGSLGDAQQRTKDYRERAVSELMKPERPGQGDDSGLDMFMRSITGGFKAGRNLGVSMDYSKQHGKIHGMIKDTEAEHGKVAEQIADFTKIAGKGVGPTVGPVGKGASRFPGAPGIVMKAMDSLRARAEPREPVAEPTRDAAGQRAAAMAAMSRTSQGIGM